jgi:hypothetical protein
LLLDTFKLKINYKTIIELPVDNWPRLPIKNIHICYSNGWKFGMEACISIVNRYRTSVEAMLMKNLELSSYELKRLLENMENLRILKFYDVKLFSEVTKPLQLPKLTTLSVIYRTKSTKNPSEEILKAFKFNKSIEALRIASINYSNISSEFFRGFIETLPRVKHLKLEVFNSSELLYSDLPQKLKSLHTYLLDTDDNVQFILNQTELKELRLRWLSDVTAAFVKNCYENLATFNLENALLISNYQPQHVEEKLDVPWEAGLEILKRGLCE